MPKILVIDDKKDNLVATSALLKTVVPDCDVILAQSGPEGIEKAKAEAPDAILLDIKMPIMDGYETCRRLKADDMTRHIPVIMLSAIKTETEDLVKGLETGADAYLAKPVDEGVLAAQVRTALRMKKAEDRLRRQKDLLEETVKERTAQLVQAQKMEAMGNLAGGIAHDFNNILSAIVGYADLAKMKLPRDSNLHSDLDQVLRSSYRARDLISQILTFSRKRTEEKTPLRASPIVKEALKFIRSSLPATIEIRENFTGERDIINANATQIHQVVMNLCTNAGHAMREEGGLLEVSLAKIDMDSRATSRYPDMGPGPYLRLTVKDTGCGMSPEVLARVFEPYFTTKHKDMGTGLGLSVVHGIISTHGGMITTYSEVGKGTTFIVYFPLLEGAAATTEKKAEAPLPRGTERILFVDDEPALAELGKGLLERLGYRVTFRTGSLEALELFRINPDHFDLVITDTTMPKMRGDLLARELMHIRPDIPIILCTGFSEHVTEKKAMEMGIKAFAMKPVVLKDLARTVRKVLDE